MMNRLILPTVIASTLLLTASPAGQQAPERSDFEIAPNTWVRTELTFLKPEHIPDAQWVTTDGYSGSAFRPDADTVIWRSGIRSRQLGLTPGFYGNATLEWAPATDSVHMLDVQDKWGGGSYGSGRLLEGFAENPQPCPRHTYDGLTYVPEKKCLYLMLGAFGRMSGGDPTDQAKEQLELDARSTWKYSIESGKWHRINDSIRRFWSSVYTVSSYESHLRYWPQGNRLLFLDDNGRHYATFDLESERWAKGELKNECPMRLYNARSAWDSRRRLWVFRLGPQLCRFDPTTATFEPLPAPYPMPEDKKDPRRVTKGVTYLSKHDVYLIAGPTGNDTYTFDPNAKTWRQIRGGDIEMVNGYIEYDPTSDLTVMVYQHHAYRFRYVPENSEASGKK
jgi:hypothetical protein